MKYLSLAFCLLFSVAVFAQDIPDKIYMPNIKTVKLFQQNNQESLPIINLNSTDLLELHFDDMDAVVKNYTYTFQLCNADWKPADVNSFDYLKGYQQNRLSQYRVSSVALTNYVHYQTQLPDKNCMPTKAGNYLLKVYLNGNQLAFTKRMFVLNKRVPVAATVVSPFDNQLSKTHQKVQFSIDATLLNAQNPQQQIVAVVQQNNRWDNMVNNVNIAFIRGNILEFDGERDCVFPAGKEYRWADLRSFRFASERVGTINKNVQPNDIYLRPDASRIQQRYLYYKDNNGWMDISTTDNVNNWWQTDYGLVHFIYIPDGNQPFINKELHLLGELTGNQISDTSLMQFSVDKGFYEKTMLLKQGYYNYTYTTKEQRKKNVIIDAAATDGNYWETENDYTVFIYYRSYSERHDELVGVATINSRTGRAGN